MRPLTPENDPPPQDNATGLRKTIKTPPEESKTRRVAKLLILIGSGQAAKIFCELDPEQVEEISREIAMVKAIGPDEAEAIFTEFQSLLSSPHHYLRASSGGGSAIVPVTIGANLSRTKKAQLRQPVLFGIFTYIGQAMKIV